MGDLIEAGLNEPADVGAVRWDGAMGFVLQRLGVAGGQGWHAVLVGGDLESLDGPDVGAERGAKAATALVAGPACRWHGIEDAGAPRIGLKRYAAACCGGGRGGRGS